MTEDRTYRPMTTWKPKGTKYEFHPAANEYPMMGKDELKLMMEDMRANGFNPRYPILILDEKIIDGRNRYNAALTADVDFLTTNAPTDADPQKEVERANEWRRHLTPDWLHHKRMERVNRVAAARQEGESTRTIAAREEVSQPQVRRDLQTAAETGIPSEPASGTVTGKDKRKHPASKPRVSRNGTPPKKPPRPVWSWDSFDEAFSELLGEVGSLVEFYGLAKSKEAVALRGLLGKFKLNFKAWQKKSAKATVKKK